MIIDSLENLKKYSSIHPLFAKAFEYLNSTDLSALEVGKFDIADGLKGIVSDKKGMTAEESCAKFECHNANIDIQVCIRGEETMGWKSRQSCKHEREPYSAEKDVQFYTDKPDMFFQLHDGQFVIFFPEDVHAPMIAEGEVKKIVIKVKI
jgi:YhcH/YjgK/YiaL family protein